MPFSDRGPVARSMRRYLGRATLTLVAVMLLSAFLLPLLSMLTLSLEQAGQRTTAGAPFYPAAPAMGTYQGETYEIYSVPIDGAMRDLMLVTKGRTESTFVDPGDPTQTPIVWQGAWRTLQQSWTFSPNIDNFTTPVAGEFFTKPSFGPFFTGTALGDIISTLLTREERGYTRYKPRTYRSTAFFAHTHTDIFFHRGENAMTQLEFARQGTITPAMEKCAASEGTSGGNHPARDWLQAPWLSRKT